jgi:hypothetical protein
MKKGRLQSPFLKNVIPIAHKRLKDLDANSRRQSRAASVSSQSYSARR